MFSQGEPVIDYDYLSSLVSESTLAYYYLGVSKMPSLIHSPLREDKKPSFSVYTVADRVLYRDFATGEGGDIYTLLGKIWHCSLTHVMLKVLDDRKYFKSNTFCSWQGVPHTSISKSSCSNSNVSLQVKIREWKDLDIDYWASFGITLPWLKYAEVYPISHIIYDRDGERTVCKADMLAYVYVEHKENNTSIKVYQPYNSKGFKWLSKHDRSVISLWSKIPKTGATVVICSSVKDALCLWCNMHIPAIAPQGEGYGMSLTAIEDLKKRYKNIYILYDSDKAGVEDSARLARQTGFTNILLPEFQGGKDLSDYYKVYGKTKFKELIKNLFENDQKRNV